MTTIKAAYEQVNALWPEGQLPMTDGEAARAARKLYRYAMGQTFDGEVEVSSGNRQTKLERDQSTWTKGKMIVNPSKGWHHFVHSLSHWFYWHANPGEKPHTKDHARFEAKLVKEVLKRGWLDGRLKVEEPPPESTDDKRLARLVRIDLLIQKWDKKACRAEAALAKLHAQRRSTLRAIEKAEANLKPRKRRAKAQRVKIEGGAWIPADLNRLAERHDISLESLPGGAFKVYPPDEFSDEDIDPHYDEREVDGLGAVRERVAAYIKLVEDAREPTRKAVQASSSAL